MTYALAHGTIQWCLLLSTLFAAGMTFTVALFPLTAVFARTWLLPLILRTEMIRNRLAVGLVTFAAITVIGLGGWPLMMGVNG
ncbi:hypothetical protein [Bradyrhizobium sp. Leo170]|uniref:hypothetical protein n=1 Tax=Bradyrhizobium sp. Leo170 TaxID=1571199 RepID=UPI00102E7DB3|nr:hypothetical protein [Bradyrhizobium sp. Leo170]TAI63397.1 hypothetical protein CWO89_24430 [Bradyrhizobium sp. Leo170]